MKRLEPESISKKIISASTSRRSTGDTCPSPRHAGRRHRGIGPALLPDDLVDLRLGASADVRTVSAGPVGDGDGDVPARGVLSAGKTAVVVCVRA